MTKVTVVIPTRNEEKYISRCIDSVISGDYPHQKLEILIVDGGSLDKTRKIAKEYADKYPFVKLLDNDEKTVPFAMNIGIRKALGEIIIRMDAHAIYQHDYIDKLVRGLEELNADNVGGSLITVPANDSLQARAVALILSHPFGVGNSDFRIGEKTVKEVDTVPFGCYRRSVFDKIGLYDEMLTRNQDDELNARLRKYGGKIYLIPSVKITYFARDNVFRMSSMLFQYGYFKPLVNLKVGWPATFRQIIPPLFVTSLFLLLVGGVFIPQFIYLFLAIIIVHTLSNSFVSISLAKTSNRCLAPLLFACFLMAHFSYGFGYMKGLLDFNLLRRHTRGNKMESSISR
jgi:glycosyltransferase involved in cell wall biosynthesis